MCLDTKGRDVGLCEILNTSDPTHTCVCVYVCVCIRGFFEVRTVGASGTLPMGSLPQVARWGTGGVGRGRTGRPPEIMSTV